MAKSIEMRIGCGISPLAVTSQTVSPNSSGGILTGKGSNKQVSYGVTMSIAEPDRAETGGGSIKVGQS